MQYVRVANQKEAAKAARGLASFVQSTIDMVSINVTDDDTGNKAYNMIIGGKQKALSRRASIAAQACVFAVPKSFRKGGNDTEGCPPP